MLNVGHGFSEDGRLLMGLAKDKRHAILSVIVWAVCLLLLLPMQAVLAGTVSQASGNLLLGPDHGHGEAWGRKKCSNCHAMQRIHKTVPKIKAIVKRKGFATCTGCHGNNGTNAKKLCLVCHNQVDLPLKPVRGGRHRHDFNSKKDLMTTSRQCIVCHRASDMDGVFELDQDLTLFNDALVGKRPYNNISEFCLRCHNRDHQQKKWRIKHAGKRDQSLRAEENYQLIDKHGIPDGDGNGIYSGFRNGTYAYSTIVQCTDCHTLHGTRNKSLIIQNSLQGVPLLEKGFREQKIKVKIVGEDYSDLCVLCHKMTTVIQGGDIPTRNGLTGVHFNEGTNCITCHNHGEEVQKGL